MTQTERIAYMEQILSEGIEAAASLQTDIERFQALGPRLAELEAYYASPQWRRDYEDDCAGKLPASLKRGVLSEDGVYNLLCTLTELKHTLSNAASSHLSP